MILGFRRLMAGSDSGGSFCYLDRVKGGAMAKSRKRAAILAANVVGFSRMTGADEDRT